MSDLDAMKAANVAAYLDAIKARCEAATPGPWAVAGKGVGAADDDRRPWIIAPDGEADPWWVAMFETEVPNSDFGLENAEFAAHARTDVPALVAEVERLGAENGELRTLLAGQSNLVVRKAKEAAEVLAVQNRYSSYRVDL